MALPVFIGQGVFPGNFPDLKGSVDNTEIDEVYFVADYGTRVYRLSPRLTGTPTRLDSGNEPTTNPNTTSNLDSYCLATCRDNDSRIHIVLGDSLGKQITYHRFNMTSDTWEVTDNVVYSLGAMATWSNGPYVSIASNGDNVVIVGDIEEGSSMGSSYSDVGFFYSANTGTPSWTGPTALATTWGTPSISCCTLAQTATAFQWYVGFKTSAPQCGIYCGTLLSNFTSTHHFTYNYSTTLNWTNPRAGLGFFDSAGGNQYKSMCFYAPPGPPDFTGRFKAIQTTNGNTGGSQTAMYNITIQNYTATDIFFFNEYVASMEQNRSGTPNRRLWTMMSHSPNSPTASGTYQRLWYSDNFGINWTGPIAVDTVTNSYLPRPLELIRYVNDARAVGIRELVNTGAYYTEMYFGYDRAAPASVSVAISDTIVPSVAYSLDISESAAIAETITPTIARFGVISESNAIVDSPAVVVMIQLESVAVADDVDAALTRFIDESAAIADQYTGNIDTGGNRGTRNENQPIAETQTVQVDFRPDQTESQLLQASQDRTADYYPAHTEAMAVAENLDVTYSVTHTEAISISESQSNTAVRIASKSEPLIVNEIIQRSIITRRKRLQDSLAISETNYASITVQQSETVAVTEILVPVYFVDINEYIEISPFNDLLTGTITHYRSILENVVIAESTNVDFTADVEEAVILSETNYAGTVEPVSVSESAAVSETQVGAATRIAHRGEVASIVPYDKFVSIETDHIESVSIVEYAFVLGEYDLVEISSILDTPNATIVRVSAVLEAVAVSETIRPSTWFEDVVESAAIVDTPDATYVDRSVDGDIEEQIGIIESTNVLLETSYNEETQVWDVPYLAGESYTDGVLTTDYVITLVQRDDAIVTVAEETEGAVVTDRAVAHIIQTAIPTTVIIRKEHKMESII